MDTPEEVPREIPPAAAEAPSPHCVNHPQVVATCLCDGCQATVCDVCAFDFPSGRHLCPVCAETAVGEVGHKARKNSHWALALGIWSLICLLGFIALAAVVESDEALTLLGGAFMILILGPNITGLVLSILCVRGKTQAPAVGVAALTLNAITLGLNALLILVGILMPA